MTKKEFLEALVEELRYLPAKQVNEVLKHYRDKIDVEIDYGTPEEKVIENMKTPKEIAENIYKMHGVNYLEKRKKNVKFKNICISVLNSVLILVCLLIFIVGSIFVFRIIGNMASLIIHAFTFKSVLDIVLTSIAVLGYMLVMIIAYIYIIDLFMILISELLTKILNANDKTRGKTFPFMEFTFTNYFNKITKKSKFLLRVLGGCAVAFLIFGISSYATKGYFYRSINEVTSKVENVEINDSFNQIEVDANEVNVVVTEDPNISKVMITYDYEFDKMIYEVIDGTLKITNKNKKLFDLLNIIKTPTSKVTIKIPTGFDIQNLNITVDYGKVIIEKSTIKNVKVYILSGDMALIQNTITKVDVEIYSGKLVTSLNNIDTMKLKHETGEYSSTEDVINKLEHNNSSSKINIVKTTVNDYKLINTSGTIYFEKIKGTNLDFLSNTSVNELYDINYDKAKLQIQNTGNLKITRSSFNIIEVTSIGNSYQTLEYIKSPSIKLNGTNGLIICEKINENYTKEELDKLGDYINYGEEYNDIEVVDTKISVTSKRADFTFNNSIVKDFELNMDSASTSITEVTTTYSNLILNNIGAELTNLMATTVDIKLTSSSLTSSSTIKYMYDKNIKVEVNLDMDGKSKFYYPNENENFVLNDKK